MMALQFFSKAIKIDPNDAKTHYLQSRAYAELGQWDAARTSIEAALKLRPGQKEFEALAGAIESRGPLPPE